MKAMPGGAPKRSSPNVITVIALFAVIAGAALLWGEYINPVITDVAGLELTRQEQGGIFGIMPNPVQPKIIDSIVKPFIEKKSKKVVIRRIPRISKSAIMPHSYWGDCVRCHLYKGAKAGKQWKSPVGKVLETVSTIMKVGPPITPNSTRPHPPAGRCIKCHDIVIERPV